MKNINRLKVFSFFLIAAYLLAACGGTLPGAAISAKAPKVDASIVAFTGIVEAINGTEWMVSGQKLTIDPQTSLDPNIAVGDEVKVEANVLSDGAVVVLKVESSVKDDSVSMPLADASSTPEPVSTSLPDASASLDASSTPDPAVPQAGGLNQNEVFGAVEAVTADTITVSGVTYSLASFTEFKDIVGMGDQVEVHVIVNADGTFTVREIEKSLGISDDDRNSDDNSNSSGSDDGPGHDTDDDNSNDNSNDDSHDDSNDHGGDDNGGSDDSGSDDD